MTHGFIIKYFANNLYVFFSLRANRTVVKKRTLKKNTKQKSKSKTMTPMYRAKQTPMKMATWKPALERLERRKTKNGYKVQNVSYGLT